MTTLNTIIEEEKKTAITKELERFHELYEDGKKKGTPRGYLEYFATQSFLVHAIDRVVASERAKIREEVDRLYSRWDGKADTQFLMELDSIISGLTPDKTNKL